MTNLADFTMLSEQVRPIAEKYGIDKILLFGSFAKGTATADSDYDFLISKGKMKSLLQYMLFIQELEHMLNKSIDVITDTSSDQTIIDIALREGILLYERA